ncbi:MAG: vanadium-dependent haloperoxidase [Bryobacteraceae bacterium]
MQTRRTQALAVRDEAARLASLRPHGRPLANGDESRYRIGTDLAYFGNFTKGLAHDALGHVNPPAYRALLRAVASGDPADFEKIPLAGNRKLVNPQAGLAFDLQGPDTGSLTIPPAPAIDSAEEASEMAELYWMALARDVPFRNYNGADPTISTAVNNLNTFSDFRGPKVAGVVTTDSLFRGITSGDLTGPYISQFMWLPVTFGTLTIPQFNLTATPGVDYMQDFATWLNVQNGFSQPPDTFDSFRRYIRNLRDLATYVHFDALYEAYLNACLILLQIKAPFDDGNPYRDSANQDGFGTFGGPHILSLVCEVATRALKSVWRQKWMVHRRLRPEAFAGLVHNQAKGAFNYNGALHPEILRTDAASVLTAVNTFNVSKGHDTFLLPMAFPEGSPIHPAYGAGHATVAGACTTILKAWFDESWAIPSPVQAAADGLTLDPWVGAPLTVGGELNKVCANISTGRNAGGVHWRTDYTESIRLGEELAIGILEEQKLCFNERLTFSLTKFDGTTIRI